MWNIDESFLILIPTLKLNFFIQSADETGTATHTYQISIVQVVKTLGEYFVSLLP